MSPVTVDLYNMKGDKTGVYDLSGDVFNIDNVNEYAVHTAVVTYLANQRQGTKSALTRAEVRGGGIKPRPQKGTGRSRQGSIRSPQWKGGGMVFAIKPRDFSLKINKKVKRLAMKSVLTTKARDNKVVVLDELSFGEIRTKNMVNVLKALNVEKALVVLPKTDKNVVLSARNLPFIETASVNTLNVHSILKYDTFIVTKTAADQISEVYA